jgi:hypothetical protein
LLIYVSTNIRPRSLYRRSKALRIKRSFFYLMLLTYYTRLISRSPASSLKSLKTPSLCGSFPSISEQDTDTLDTTLRTQDEIHEVLLSLFYPWNRLQGLQSGHLESLCAALYKNTWLLWKDRMYVPSKCTIVRATGQVNVQAQTQRTIGGRGNAQRNGQNTQKNRLYSMSVKKTRIKARKLLLRP